MKNLSITSIAIVGFALSFLSCSKESSVEPSDPIESLKEWFLLNSTSQGQENIIWNKAKAIKLKDSSITFALPVI